MPHPKKKKKYEQNKQIGRMEQDGENRICF